MSDIWIPILGVIFFFSTIILVFYFHYQSKSRKLDTVVKLAESGGEVRPEMIELLGREGGPTGDLRKGLIWLAIGVPVVIGLLIGEGGEAAAFGLIPVLIGVAYLVVYKIGYQDGGEPPGA